MAAAPGADGPPMARVAAVLALVLCALAPGVAWGAGTAEMIGAYAAQRDATVVTARDAISSAGPGTPGARAAAADARARLASLADALRASTAGEARAGIDARLAADGLVADALADHAAGRIDAAGLDAALEVAAADAARAGDVTTGAGGMDVAEIVQAVGGPMLLVGVIAIMSWRAARSRRTRSRS